MKMRDLQNEQIKRKTKMVDTNVDGGKAESCLVESVFQYSNGRIERIGNF